jgi:membrane-associated phospholipid phosphatase
VTLDPELARSRARRMLILSIVCIVLLGIVYYVAVHTEWGQRIDEAALDGRTTRESVLRATDRLLDTISAASFALGSLAILVVALARRRPHLALTAGVVIGGSFLTTQLLKREILDRPNLLGLTDPAQQHNWLPSGHSTVAMALVAALVIVVAEEARPIVALAGLAYATMVGAGTVTLGWHRPSDVLAAYLVVTAWAGASVAVLLWTEGVVRERASSLAQRVPSLSPFLTGAGIGLLLGALFGVGGTLVAARTEELDAVQLDATYAASIVVITGAALVLLVAIVAGLRGIALDPTADEQHGVVPTPVTT